MHFGLGSDRVDWTGDVSPRSFGAASGKSNCGKGHHALTRGSDGLSRQDKPKLRAHHTCRNPSLVLKLNRPTCFSSSSWMAREVYAGVYLGTRITRIISEASYQRAVAVRGEARRIGERGEGGGGRCRREGGCL